MDETSIISKLESSDPTGIQAIFSDYLSPFSDVTNPPKSKRPSKPKDDRQALARSLAKKFLPLLNRALGALPKRLDDRSKLGGNGGDGLAQEFFETYWLCLTCLESVSSQLSGKPHAVQLQRFRLMRCLEAWGRWKEAEAEGLKVLEKLKETSLRAGKCEPRLLPDAEKGDGDKEIGNLVVDIVVRLVRYVLMRESKDVHDYHRVLRLVEESKRWFRLLDANTLERLHRPLVNYLGKCAVFLVGELTFVDEDLARKFCITTITELVKSSAKDTIYKIACKICSSLFSLQDSRSTFTINILICVLDSLLHEGKVEWENNGIEFVELIAYCSNKCKVNPDFCNSIGAHLSKIVDDQVKTPFNWILRLYATGLLVMNYKLKSKSNDISSSGGLVQTLCAGDVLQNLAALLCSLRSYYHKGRRKNCTSFSVDDKYAICLLCSATIFHKGDSVGETHESRKACVLAYLSALKFVCHPLAEVVSLEKKQIISGCETAAVSSGLCHIEDAFYQFSDAFFFLKRCKSICEAEKDGFDETNILSIAVASFILSLGTKLSIQKSVNLLEDVISSEWIQPNGLKYLFSALYNVGVTLYKDEKLKEAFEALKLSNRAAWTCILHLCDMLFHKPDGSCGDLSEDAILNFFNESCTRNACLLNSLHQHDSHELKSMIIESLEMWSVAANLFNKLPSPTSLVKQWVKIECRNHKKADVQETDSTFFNVLSPNAKVSKRTVGIILEQELHAYAEVNALNPELCQKMQMKIIGYLLEDVYAAPESWLQRSRILVQKGRVIRLYGHGLQDCIQCLSDAISSLEAMSGETCQYSVQTSYQLAMAYCLRACCTQEAEPNSKQIYQDIRMTLKLWLSNAVPDCFSAKETGFIAPENMMILLYNITDLLSLKGCMDFHYDIYRLMLRLFQWKKVPLEKSTAVLWQCRRLRHALCVSPVHETFLKSLEDNYNGLTKSIDFWISCLKGSKALLVGFEHTFSFLYANFSQGSFNDEFFFPSNITVDEVKNAAHQLISEVPAPTSVFVASALFYDLSERLISNGHITEALIFAKEALRIRAILFGERFKLSMEQQSENSSNIIDVIRKFTCSLQDLQVRRSVANELWSLDTISWDLENCYLSPWIILQCYLESTLQVGVACELIGNGAEAEGLLLWGKSVSYLQNLPLFMASFSSVLGKLYCKKQLWDLAEKELHSAKQCLEVSNKKISCSKCRLMLEVTVDQQLGDLSLSIINSSTGRPSIESASHAGALYKSALDKLNHSEWESSSSCPEVACFGSSVADVVENQLNVKKPSKKEPKETMEVKKCRKTRNAAKPITKDHNPMPANSLRTTRFKNKSCQSKSMCSEVHVSKLNHMQDNDGSECCSGTYTEVKSSNVDFGCQDIHICNKLKCWHCLQIEAMKNGLLNNLIDINWEFFRRRLLLRLLIGLGNYLESCEKIHEAHKIFLQSILILVNQDRFHLTASSVCEKMLLDIIGKEVSEDMFTVERAELLYNLSLISLKCHRTRGTRVACCDMSLLQLPQLVAWLMQIFVSCCEVPMLFQKVSRLLAVIFLLSATGELGSLSSYCKALSENQWASFFHQASVGTHLNYQFFTSHDWIPKVKNLLDAKGSYITGSTCLRAETQNFPRLAPESIQDLEDFVLNFFAGFPCTTATCISLLGSPYAGLLQEILLYSSSSHAWMLVSRLDSKSQPIVLLLPMDSILEEASEEAGISGVSCSERKTLDRHWKCPWGSTMVDDVAPEFRLILEENYISSSNFPLEDTAQDRKLWWTRRKKLDHRLGNFLRNLEDLWLGPWKYMLLGPRSNCKNLDSVHKKLARSLKSKCKTDVYESLLRVMLGAPKDAFEEEEFISRLCLRNGCYIGRTKWCNKDGHCSSSSDSGGLNKLSSLAFQLVREAVNELENEGCLDREPVMLVLDFDVQMLPWENVPILRNQEVYRMPSVWSISAILHRSFNNQEQIRTYPFIDPLDAFYLLNPGGDLGDTQIEFENWFKDQNLQGKAGCAPTAEELAAALKNHDLFLYFGHGSGAQYIPGCEIQKLENCAATLLMGCSSGSLTLNGCYAPKGTPLSYLLASSPVIVANLWEVTDKDIDRFAKTLLDAWFKERVSASSGCAKCSIVAEELEALSLKGRKGNAKKKVTRKKTPEPCEEESVMSCDHRPKIGSFIAQARDACTLRFLIGASPVCYGVPTGIKNKKDLA